MIPCILSVSPLLLVSFFPLLLLSVPLVSGNYRQFGFHNHDLCTKDEEGRSLQLGAGAALLSLDSTGSSLSEYYSKCSVKIEADEGFGLMVYVEEMSLRVDSRFSADEKKGCVDYVQFGRDDLIPFFTVYKSAKLCGNRTGFHYDEPGGKLLVWLNLGPIGSNPFRDGLETDRLTVVITAYKHGTKEESANFRLCGSGDRLIRKEYFCDNRVNCALDRPEPGDERPEICRHSRGAVQDGGGAVHPPGEWHPPLNLVSITLVLVSGVVLLVLLLLLVARLRRAGWGRFGRDGSIDCELPDRAAGLTRAGAGHRAGTGLVRGGQQDRQENVYLPLAMYLEPRQEQGPVPRPPPRGTTPDAEPPPAYHDLFPAGYKFESEKSGDTSLNLMSSKSEDQIDTLEAPLYGEVSRNRQSSQLLPRSDPSSVAPETSSSGLILPTVGTVEQTSMEPEQAPNLPRSSNPPQQLM